MATDTSEDVFSEGEATIECRSCSDPMPVDQKNCPHCGARVITGREAGAIAFAGLVIAALTGYAGLWPFTVVGLLALAVGAVLFQSRRQKIQDARGL